MLIYEKYFLYYLVIKINNMKYMDFTGVEIEKLHDFHLAHPDAVIRVSADKITKYGEIVKIANILGTDYSIDIADKTLDE